MMESPPPLSGRQKEGGGYAIWSLSLTCFVWVVFLAVCGFLAWSKPTDSDEVTWFVTGACFLVLFAALLVSIALAIAVLVQRRKGAVLAIIALVLSALPFLLFAASAIRATFHPSS